MVFSPVSVTFSFVCFLSYLWYAHSEHSVSQLLPDEEPQHLEGSLEPERCSHY